jgi:hypothetical protein
MAQLSSLATAAIRRSLSSLLREMYVCMYVCMYVRIYVYMYYVRMYVCTMYVCTYVGMYVCTYVCMYVLFENPYIYTWASSYKLELQRKHNVRILHNYNTGLYVYCIPPADLTNSGVKF